MLENLTLYERIRIWLSDFPYMEKPLNWLDGVVDGAKILFQTLGVWFRYILILFALTLLFIFLKVTVRFIRNWMWASFSEFSDDKRMSFWSRYAQADEKRALSEVAELFSEAKKDVRKIRRTNVQPIGFNLFYQIMNALGQGMSTNEILKLLPSKYSLIDVAPLIDAVCTFRDLAARKILETHSRERRHYSRALRDLSQGHPQKAAHLLKEELMKQQKVTFLIKDALLQHYARKEASQLSLSLALILGVYDTQLADKAYRRAIELNPKDPTARILYGNFRQRLFGQNDKVMSNLFLSLTKNVDKTIQNYMFNYAVEMIRKTEVRSRLDEIRARFQDEKERYNEAVQIERLKIREALKMARMRSIAQEERLR